MKDLLVYTYYKSSMFETFLRNMKSLTESINSPIALRILCNRPIPAEIIKPLSKLVQSVEHVRVFDADTEYDYLSVMSEIPATGALYVDPNLFFVKQFSFNREISTFFSTTEGHVSTKIFFIKPDRAFDAIKNTLRTLSLSRKLTSSDLNFSIANNFLFQKDIVQNFVCLGKSLVNGKFKEPKDPQRCIDLNECLGSRYTILTDYIQNKSSNDQMPTRTLPHIIKKVATRISEKIDEISEALTSPSLNSTSEFKNPTWPTVVIPVYKNLEDLKRCMESILNSTDRSFNLLVINDSPTESNIEHFLVGYESSFYSKYGDSAEYIHLTNQSNLGFVKTVNLAISKCSGDVILLNSDTLVSNNWISRLLEYKKFAGVASVTPLSNSASICSFPKFNVNQSHYRNLTPEQIDSVLMRLPPELCHEAPTGVGFCMLMTRSAINEIGVFDAETFILGYGEENDWCMRALAAGFKNLIAPNIYVAHEHGASFKSVSNLSTIRENNARALVTKHPSYNRRVQEYLSKNELSTIVPALTHALDYEYFVKKNQTTAILISHTLGGGSTQFSQLMQQKQLSAGIDCIRITRTRDSDLFSVAYSNSTKTFTYSKTALTALIHALGPKSIMLNHFISWDQEDIHEIFTNIKIPYAVYLHDFYWVCPTINFVNSSGEFCNAETRVKTCESCFAATDGYTRAWAEKTIKSIGVSGWRRLTYEIFEKAQEIACPSNDTKNWYLKYFPEFNDKIRIWTRDPIVNTVNSFSETVLTSKTLKVVTLGGISKIKGERIIYEMNDIIVDKNLPIELIVIGVINQPQYPTKHSRLLKVTGPYNNSDVPDLLMKHRPAIGLVPSIWPETYSYTTSELFTGQIPVMCFDIGAPADRVKQIDAGWAVPEMTASAMVSELMRLHSQRFEILEKHKNLEKIGPLSNNDPKFWFN